MWLSVLSFKYQALIKCVSLTAIYPDGVNFAGHIVLIILTMAKGLL